MWFFNNYFIYFLAHFGQYTLFAVAFHPPVIINCSAASSASKAIVSMTLHLLHFIIDMHSMNGIIFSTYLITGNFLILFYFFGLAISFMSLVVIISIIQPPIIMHINALALNDESIYQLSLL